MEDAENTQINQEPSPNILVFQCESCLTIVGDSQSFVIALDKLNIICLQKASCVGIETVVHFSMEAGCDIGCSFNDISCSMCKTIIGRRYLSTNAELDSIRNLFSFYVCKVLTYYVGSNQMEANLHPPFDLIPTFQSYREQSDRVYMIQMMSLGFKDMIHDLRKEISSLKERNEFLSTKIEEISLQSLKS
eukprot:TRINITY_DN1501_c0_g1_i5.p1 TRINITY_DN1501_c0_g1~~TRINITY_DN1501_c0_g1_i5.p1  ORF type:complete len:217 (+),score=29.52 TRINITY_DN1501_c0_g1_i5:83-652(+)